jgi:hypothetical protein
VQIFFEEFSKNKMAFLVAWNFKHMLGVKDPHAWNEKPCAWNKKPHNKSFMFGEKKFLEILKIPF